MIEVKSKKIDNIVTPHEYIDENNNIVLALSTARDKNENVLVIFKNGSYNIRALSKKDFLEKYEYCLSEATISIKPNNINRIPLIKEKEIHRDEELDVFKSFQENTMKEIGEFKIE